MVRSGSRFHILDSALCSPAYPSKPHLQVLEQRDSDQPLKSRRSCQVWAGTLPMYATRAPRNTCRVWWGRWDLNPRPPGFSRFRSRAGYHTMLDNGPKRRNRATVPNSIFLRLAGNSSYWHRDVNVFSASGLTRVCVGFIPSPGQAYCGPSSRSRWQERRPDVYCDVIVGVVDEFAVPTVKYALTDTLRMS